MLTAGEYLEGAAFLAFVIGASGIGAWILAARWYRLGEASGILAIGLLTAALVFLAHLVPGALGLLTRGGVALTALLLLGACAFGRRRIAPAAAFEHEGPAPDERVSWVLAIVGLAAVGAYVAGALIAGVDEGLLHVDVVSFHLSNVAAWMQDNSLWGVDDWIPNRAAGNYPQTGDVFSLAAMLPFSGDFLARLVGLPFLGLAGLGAFAACRELQVPASTAALVTAALISIPAVAYSATQGLADVAMLGMFAPGAYFLLRHWRTDRTADLLLAGVGLGLAFGTRWYAVSAILAVIVIWATFSFAAGRGVWATLRSGAVLAGLVATLGGFWLLRNWVESGNPVFPVKVAPFGLTIFDAPVDVFRELNGFSLADYFSRPGIFRDFIWDSYLGFMSFAALALWALVTFAGLRAVRLFGLEAEGAGGRGGHGRPLALALAAALIGIAYVFTPYTASGPEGAPTEGWVNARYVIPALVVGAPAVGWVIGGAGRWRPLLEVGVLLTALDGVRRSIDLPLGDPGTGFLLTGVGITIGAIALVGLRPRLPMVRAPALAAGAAAAVALVIAGYVVEESYEDGRYAGLGRPIELAESAPGGTDIGLLGDGFGNYPLFGPRLGNDVEFLGARVDGMLRSLPDRGALVEELGTAAPDLVVVQNIDTLTPGLPEAQERWLRSLGWARVASGPHPNLGFAGVEMRLYGPHEPAGAG